MLKNPYNDFNQSTEVVDGLLPRFRGLEETEWGVKRGVAFLRGSHELRGGAPFPLRACPDLCPRLWTAMGVEGSVAPLVPFGFRSLGRPGRLSLGVFTLESWKQNHRAPGLSG